MFESSLFKTQPRRGFVFLGWIIEALLMALVVLIPLLHMQDLPLTLHGAVLVVPPPSMGAPEASRSTTAPRPARQSTLTPTLIPRVIVWPAVEPEAAPQAPAPNLANGVPRGDGNGALTSLGIIGLPPPPAPARTSKPPAVRVRVGGQVEGAKLIFQVKPSYPEIARLARVQGTVRLEAVISKEGMVESLKALSGPPLLVKAAVDAVSRWRYQPTLLNGEPVEVSTEIEVNFTLGE